MNVVSYQSYNTPANHHALITNIKDFATSIGWTIDDYKASDSWGWIGGSVYGWTGVAGQSFVQMHSHVGSAYIGARLLGFTQSNYSYANMRRIALGGFRSTEETPSTASSTNPCFQGTNFNKGPADYGYCYNCYQLATSDVSYLKQYCFGTTSFIHSIIQYDATYSFQIFFGMPEIFIESGDVLMTIMEAFGSGGYYGAPLTTCAGQNYEYNDAAIAINGTAYTAYPFSKQYQPPIAGGGTTFAGVNYSPALLPNTFALARPILRDGVTIIEGGIRKLIGYLPFGWAATSGLQAWQELDYGAETYIVCPVSMDAGSSCLKKMIAYRIA